MNIDQIAARFTDRPHTEPGDIAIDHPYRARWWLPIIGPTATCALTHLAADAMSSNWQLTPATDYAVRRAPLGRLLPRPGQQAAQEGLQTQSRRPTAREHRRG